VKIPEVFVYKAKVLDVYDGDTFTLLIDIGFKIYLNEKCRLMGLNCPEVATRDLNEKAFGFEVRDYVKELILDKEITIRTYKEGKFGRYLIDLYLEDGTKLNDLLIEKKYAKPYNGGRRGPWFE